MENLYCPVCGAANPVDAVQCHQCQEDLVTVRELIDSAKTHYNEALALAHSGRLDEATGQIEAAITLFGHNPEYHNLLGTIHAQKGQYENAIRAWERCLALEAGMENAYRNIGKAQGMIEEDAEEQRKRPFLLASIGASILAAIFLLTTIFLSLNVFLAKNPEIASLKFELEEAKTAAASWEKKFETLDARFPAGGIEGLNQLIEKQKQDIEKQATQIDSLEERWKKNLEQRSGEFKRYKDQIDTLQEQKTQLEKRVSIITKLQATVTADESKLRAYAKTVEEQARSIESASGEIADVKAQLALARRSLETVKSDSDVNLDSTKKIYDKTVENLRGQVRDLRDEIGELQRDRVDSHYVGGLVIEALKNVDRNNYQAANKSLETALARKGDDIIALYLREAIQRILNDPVELESLNRHYQNRNALREEIRKQLVDRDMTRAREHFKEGHFTLAVEAAQEALAILSTGAPEVDTCQKLIQDAEADNEKLTMWLADARRYISQQDYKQAQTLVKLALKRAPDHEEALDLKKQLSQ